jgi:uncharacterized membrane protein
MRILNPFKLNDIEINKLFLIILFLGGTISFLALLDNYSVHIPLLREFLSFIYLLLIPGVLILRILKIHGLSDIYTILYSVGLSITTIMLIGFFMNMIYPLIGILNPISQLYSIITINSVIILLCIASYIRDKDFSSTSYLKTEDILSPWILSLSIIPFLSIFGPYLVNYYNNDLIQVILILIIALLLPLSIKRIPKKFYPYTLFIIGLSLLFHTSLISSYVWGQDVSNELYLSSIVLTNSIWNITIHDDYNAMLSLVILPPLFSLISNISLVWIYKIVFPAIFALVPVGLYLVFKKQTNSTIAFFSSYFFMSIYTFYNVLPALGRQEIAEVFFMLLILLFLSQNIREPKKSILIIIFGASMVISHYSTAIIFIAVSIIAWMMTIKPISKFLYISLNSIFNFFMKSLRVFDFIRISVRKKRPLQFHKLYKMKFNLKNQSYNLLQKPSNNYTLLDKAFIAFLVVFAITWFFYMTQSSIFDATFGTIFAVTGAIGDLFDPVASQGTMVIMSNLPIFQSIEKYCFLISQMFIVVGVVALFFGKNKFNNEFKLFSIITLLVLILSVVLPYVGSSLNVDRIFHIALFFLSVFFVTGFLIMIRYVSKFLKLNIKSKETSLYILSVFLIIFFLFSSSLVYQIFDQEKDGRFALDNTVKFASLNQAEIGSIEWLYSSDYSNYTIYTDNTFFNPVGSFRSRDVDNSENVVGLSNNNIDINFNNSYIFLAPYNIMTNQYYTYIEENNTFYDFYRPNLTSRMNIIYDNSQSRILWS